MNPNNISTNLDKNSGDKKMRYSIVLCGTRWMEENDEKRVADGETLIYLGKPLAEDYTNEANLKYLIDL